MDGQEQFAEDSGSRRALLVAQTVDYLVDHGLAGLSLRPLARALGTSDRMLLYYFQSRDALVAAALEAVAHRLRDVFAAALADPPLSPSAMLQAALSVSTDDDARRLLGLWLQVVGLCAAGDRSAAATVRSVIEEWLRWLAERIDLPAAERRAAAAALLAVIDGLIVLETAGAEDETRAGAAWLIAALPGAQRR